MPTNWCEKGTAMRNFLVFAAATIAAIFGGSLIAIGRFLEDTTAEW